MSRMIATVKLLRKTPLAVGNRLDEAWRRRTILVGTTALEGLVSIGGYFPEGPAHVVHLGEMPRVARWTG